MVSKMAKMVKKSHKKVKRNTAITITVKQAPQQQVQQSTDDMGLGGIITTGAKTIIGVGLLNGIAGAMGNMNK